MVEVDSTAGLISDQDLEVVVRWIRNTQGTSVDDEKMSNAIEKARLGATPGITLQYGTDLLPVASLRSQDAPEKFRFVADPAPAPGEPDC